MTTIVGVETKNGFTIAADSQTTEGERAWISKDTKKITEVGEYVIAGAGVSNLCDVALYGWQPPEYDGTDLYTFMVSVFIPALRGLHTDVPKETDGASFLVGINSKLFYIGEDYAVLRTNTGLYGIGSGANWAIGAISAGATIKEAMKIAVKLDINSSAPIQIVKRGTL